MLSNCSRALKFTAILGLTGCQAITEPIKAAISGPPKIPEVVLQSYNAELLKEQSSKSGVDADARHTAAIEDLTRALSYCNAMDEFYGNRARFGDASETTLAIFGIGAATVVVPGLAAAGAAKSTMAVWSSMGGAATAINTQANKSISSPEHYLAIQSTVQNGRDTWLSSRADVTKVTEDVINAIPSLYFVCSAAPKPASQSNVAPLTDAEIQKIRAGLGH
ncbi:hypothetical protein [Silvimonas iriomotensis]|uniref:hypothetical protein n=1 Tax=Silvimonas iriomotensis TaxID=449662 RepID=UPI001663ACDC|nr:hypothetical protein [Silvimonas iriomotensis]